MFSIYDLLKEKVGLCYYDDETEYIYRQHVAIVEAIKARDEFLAQAKMVEHLAYIESLLNRLIGKETGEVT
jgi:DNA-binding FadR family transcriptional regulator